MEFTGSDVAGLAGSIINGIFGHKSQKSANKTNLQIAQMNNDAMLQQMRENNQWNWDKSVEMFNMENDYNSPEQQMARFRAAGLNPYVAMSEGLGSAGTTPADGSTPTAESVPQFQQAQVQPVPTIMNGVLDSVLKITQAKAASQQAAKTKQEREQSAAMFDSLLSQVQDEALQAKLKSVRDAIDTNVYGKQRSQELSKLGHEVMKAKSDAEIAKAQAEIEKVREKFEKMKGNRMSEEIEAYFQSLTNRLNLEKETIKTEQTKQTANKAAANASNASANASNSSAKYYDALTNTENALRHYREEEMRLKNELYDIDAAERSAVLGPKINSLIQQYESNGSASFVQLAMARQLLEKAEKENSWYNWNQVLNYVSTINDGVATWLSPKAK